MDPMSISTSFAYSISIHPHRSSISPQVLGHIRKSQNVPLYPFHDHLSFRNFDFHQGSIGTCIYVSIQPIISWLLLLFLRSCPTDKCLVRGTIAKIGRRNRYQDERLTTLGRSNIIPSFSNTPSATMNLFVNFPFFLFKSLSTPCKTLSRSCISP